MAAFRSPHLIFSADKKQKKTKPNPPPPTKQNLTKKTPYSFGPAACLGFLLTLETQKRYTTDPSYTQLFYFEMLYSSIRDV